MSSQLDRIEAIVASNTLAIQALGQKTDANALAIQALGEKTEANALAIQALGEKTEANANAIKVLTEHQAQYAEQLRSEVSNLAGMINTLAHQHGETIERIDTIVAEVRGLQTENRRIMERWGNGNG